MTICHCKTGVMSQCEAADCYEEQQECEYYRGASKALGVLKCMFLNKGMNNHCWSPDAQIAADGIDIVDSETEETLEDLMEEVDDLLPDKDDGKGARQCCSNCIHTPCSEVMAERRRLGQPALSENEQWALGSKCDNYDDGSDLLITVVAPGGP